MRTPGGPPPPRPFSPASYRGVMVGTAGTAGSVGGASIAGAGLLLFSVAFLPCALAETCDVPSVSDRAFEATAFAGSLVGVGLAVGAMGRDRGPYAGPLRLPRPDVRRGDGLASVGGVLVASVPGVIAARALGRQLPDEDKPAAFALVSLAQGAGAAVAVHLRRRAQEREATRGRPGVGANP